LTRSARPFEAQGKLKPAATEREKQSPSKAGKLTALAESASGFGTDLKREAATDSTGMARDTETVSE